MASYARDIGRFEAAGLEIAAVVVDPVPNNRAMVEKLLLPFPILSDPEGDVIRRWGVWSDGEGGIAKPAVFVVRPDRSIAFEMIGDDYADRPVDEQILAAVGGEAAGGEG